MLPERGRGYDIVRAATRTVKCRECGKEFKTNVTNQKTCSESCRREFDRKYVAEYQRKRRAKGKGAVSA